MVKSAKVSSCSHVAARAFSMAAARMSQIRAPRGCSSGSFGSKHSSIRNGNGVADAEGLLQRHERELCHHIHRCQRLLLQHHRPCFAFGVQESAVNPAWQRPNADLGNGRKSIIHNVYLYLYIYFFFFFL